MDFTSISDSETERVMHGSPEICLVTDNSPVSAKDFYSSTDRIQSYADLSASVQSMRVEVNDMKKLIDSVEEKNVKFRIVVLSFMLSAVLAAIVVCVNTGEEVPYYGPLPT